MNAQSIRRSVLVSLLAMPLSAIAQNTAQDAASDAAPLNPVAKLDLSLDLWPDRMGHYLTTEQLQVIGEPSVRAVDVTPKSEALLEDVMISGKRETEAPPAFPVAVKPCGLASVVWAMEHPADVWRVVAPIAFSPELQLCLTSDTAL